MTRIFRLCQAAISSSASMWDGLWQARPEEQPRPDTSYEEVSPEQIRRMNEHAQSAFATGNWVTEPRES